MQITRSVLGCGLCWIFWQLFSNLKIIMCRFIDRFIKALFLLLSFRYECSIVLVFMCWLYSLSEKWVVMVTWLKPWPIPEGEEREGKHYDMKDTKSPLEQPYSYMRVLLTSQLCICSLWLLNKGMSSVINNLADVSTECSSNHSSIQSKPQ